MPKSKVRKKKNGKRVSGRTVPRERRKTLEKKLDEAAEAYDWLLEAEQELLRREAEEQAATEDEEAQDAG